LILSRSCDLKSGGEPLHSKTIRFRLHIAGGSHKIKCLDSGCAPELLSLFSSIIEN
jgi:hypothetical protein